MSCAGLLQDEVLIAGFGRRGHAVGDIPGVRFKVQLPWPSRIEPLLGCIYMFPTLINVSPCFALKKLESLDQETGCLRRAITD